MRKNRSKARKGFTLIELLIVIALLGALAVGLLAALDPFEQLKKGTDTSARNTVSEVQGSIIRYYALKSYMPWCTDPNTCTNPSTTNLSTTPMDAALSRIADSGELKSNFAALAGANLGKIYVTGTTTSVIVCYSPTSRSFKCDQNTKYTQAGVVDANCPGTSCGTSTSCYWCVQ